jgi:hypothetical protein
VPDRCGQGEEALADAGADAGEAAAFVAFEVELSFEGVEDGLDDLAQWFEELLPGRACSLDRVGRIRSIPSSVRSVSNTLP